MSTNSILKALPICSTLIHPNLRSQQEALPKGTSPGALVGCMHFRQDSSLSLCVTWNGRQDRSAKKSCSRYAEIACWIFVISVCVPYLRDRQRLNASPRGMCVTEVCTLQYLCAWGYIYCPLLQHTWNSY